MSHTLIYTRITRTVCERLANKSNSKKDARRAVREETASAGGGLVKRVGRTVHGLREAGQEDPHVDAQAHRHGLQGAPREWARRPPKRGPKRGIRREGYL